MSVTAPKGFVASAMAAGIRRRQVPDLAMVRSLTPATGAGMFTTNQVRAAPVVVSMRHLEAAQPQAVVINSGVANAATGARGELDAMATAADTARLLSITTEEVVVLSTGLIGAPLPLSKIRAGLPTLASSLSPEGGAAAAGAILTTDTRTKTKVVSRSGITVGGMAKGAGMIHPKLATMLAVITTDASLSPQAAAEVLAEAVDESFNKISVDGECSTNDAVILVANGATDGPGDPATVREAICEVAADLSQQIVADGEGATVIIDVQVSGGLNDHEARSVAERVATSSLVKTAAFGRDPNWGRVVAAAGAAPVGGSFALVDVDEMTISFNGTKVFAEGRPTGYEPDMSPAVLSIDLSLGLGDSLASYSSTDLTYDYVKINAEYTT